ncbi:hypothetical protein MMC14_004643 [Varicellaria rhodocarpa]|nr:hypothetical protein [Varicellaria rhodocarpa]
MGLFRDIYIWFAVRRRNRHLPRRLSKSRPQDRAQAQAQAQNQSPNPYPPGSDLEILTNTYSGDSRGSAQKIRYRPGDQTRVDGRSSRRGKERDRPC